MKGHISTIDKLTCCREMNILMVARTVLFFMADDAKRILVRLGVTFKDGTHSEGPLRDVSNETVPYLWQALN